MCHYGDMKARIKRAEREAYLLTETAQRGWLGTGAGVNPWEGMDSR